MTKLFGRDLITPNQRSGFVARQRRGRADDAQSGHRNDAGPRTHQTSGPDENILVRMRGEASRVGHPGESG